MDRNEFVDQLIKQLTPDQQVNIQDWWWIHADRNNWRLTWQGYNDFKDILKLESWDFDFESRDLKPWIYLKLARHLKIPFYIVDNKKHNKLVLFDSKSAMMVRLYGDLIKWIRTLD
jgi:hypothetical protein